MSRVSILDVEQDRFNDAAHFGLLRSSNVARGRKVHTGLETTQETRLEPPRPLSESRRQELLRRAREKEKTRTDLRNMLRSPVIEIAPVQETQPHEFDRKSEPPRVVVVVERTLLTTLLSGKPQIWLNIYQRNDKRRSCRPPTFSDQSVLQSKYPFFFLPWYDAPSSVDCLGAWIDGEWSLLNVFDPFAR